MHRLLTALALAVLCGCSRSQPPLQPMRVDGMTATLRLPVKYVGSADTSPTKLTLSAGAEDEREEGPQSFAVLADESIAVADPLARRIAVYGANGVLVRSEPAGFAMDDVAGDSTVIARDAVSELWFSRGPSGAFDLPASAPAATGQLAKLLGADRAFVPGVGADPERTGISVLWAGSRLAAVERLGDDPDGSAYIAIESTNSGLDQMEKTVRKYAPGGVVVAEVRGIPLDYYVTPRTEFRTRAGKLYQLQTRADEVRINIWDLRPVPVGGK